MIVLRICSPLVRWDRGPQDTRSGPGEAEFTPEASSLWMRKAPRPLREHRGVSEARKAEPASTRLAREGTGSGNLIDIINWE